MSVMTMWEPRGLRMSTRRGMCSALVGLSLMLVVTSSSWAAAPSCPPSQWPCSSQVNDAPLAQAPERFKFQATVAVSTVYLDSGYFETLTVKLLSGDSEVLCKENFSNVLVEGSVLNLVIGENMTCELSAEILENSNLSLQLCPQDESNCLVPIGFEAAPYAIRSTYANAAEKANYVNSAAQAHYALRLTNDRDLGLGKKIDDGYFDFESGDAGAMTAIHAATSCTAATAASVCAAGEVCDASGYCAKVCASSSDCAQDQSCVNQSCTRHKGGFVTWRHEATHRPSLHVSGKRHVTDSLVELKDVVIAADEGHVTGSVYLYPGEYADGTNDYPTVPLLSVASSAHLSSISRLAGQVGLLITSLGAEIIGSTTVFGDAGLSCTLANAATVCGAGSVCDASGLCARSCVLDSDCGPSSACVNSGCTRKPFALSVFQVAAALGGLQVDGHARIYHGSLQVWSQALKPATTTHSLQVSDQGAKFDGHVRVTGHASAGQNDALSVTRAPRTLPGDCTVVTSGGDGGDLIVCTTPLSWSAARARCQAMQGDLATIHSAEVNAALQPASGARAWIGLNDTSSEGNFTWIDGSTSSYRSFASAQPDNNGEEDCVEMMFGSNTWDDRDCTIALPYACRLPSLAISAVGNASISGYVFNDAQSDATTPTMDASGSLPQFGFESHGLHGRGAHVTGDGHFQGSLKVEQSLDVTSSGTVDSHLTVDGAIASSDNSLPITAKVEANNGVDVTIQSSESEWFIDSDSSPAIVQATTGRVEFAPTGTFKTQVSGAVELRATATVTNGDVEADGGLHFSSTQAAGGFLYPNTPNSVALPKPPIGISGNLSVTGPAVTSPAGTTLSRWTTTQNMEAQGDYNGDLPAPCTAGDPNCNTKWYWGINDDACVYIDAKTIPIDLDSSATYACNDTAKTDCTATRTCATGYSCLPNDVFDLASECSLTKLDTTGSQCEVHDCYNYDVKGYCGDGICDLGESCEGSGVILPAVPSSCSIIGQADDGDNFVLCTDYRNWSSAQSACQAMGGHLASFTSTGEMAILAAASNASTWIGLNDQSSENSWQWVDPAHSYSYTNWNGGEPNNAGNEDCVEMYSNGKWNDNQCYHSRRYACRLPSAGSYPNDNSQDCKSDCGSCGTTATAQTYGRPTATRIAGATGEKYYDCHGNPYTRSWVGDGLCDDGNWGAHFNCAAFDYDGGDCCKSTCDRKVCFWFSCWDYCDFLTSNGPLCKDPDQSAASDFMFSGNAELGQRACNELDSYIGATVQATAGKTEASVMSDLYSGTVAQCLSGGANEDKLFCEVARSIHEGKYSHSDHGGHNQCTMSGGAFESVSAFADLCASTPKSSCAEGNLWELSCGCAGRNLNDHCKTQLVDSYVTSYCNEGGVSFDAASASTGEVTDNSGNGLSCLNYLVNDYPNWVTSTVGSDPFSYCKGSNCRERCPPYTLPASTAQPLRCCEQQLTLRSSGATGTLYLTVDNAFTTYINGVQKVFTNTNSAGTDNVANWTRASSYNVTENGVLAISAQDTGGPAGILATFTGGAVSDSNWRCISKYAVPADADWTNPCFDDSSWPAAVKHEQRGAETTWTGLVDTAVFSTDAWWIWTANNNDDNQVYCRVQVGSGPVCIDTPPEIHEVVVRYAYDLDGCGDGKCADNEFEGQCTSAEANSCEDRYDCSASAGVDCSQVTNTCALDCDANGGDKGTVQYLNDLVAPENQLDAPVYVKKTTKLTCGASQKAADGTTAVQEARCSLSGASCTPGATVGETDTDTDGIPDSFDVDVTAGTDADGDEVDDRYDPTYTGGKDFWSSGSSATLEAGANKIDDAFEPDFCVTTDTPIGSDDADVVWTVKKKDGTQIYSTEGDATNSLLDLGVASGGNPGLLLGGTATCTVTVKGYCSGTNVRCLIDSDCPGASTCTGAHNKSMDVKIALDNVDNTCDNIDDDDDSSVDEDYVDPNCAVVDTSTHCTAGTPSCTNCNAGFYPVAGVCTPCECDDVNGTCDTALGCLCNAGYSGDGVTCTECLAGTAKPLGNGNCTACATGTHAAAGSASCTACSCPGNNVSCSATSGACLCDAGFQMVGGECTECPAGTSAAKGTNTCTPCAAGTFAAAGASSCADCGCGANATCDAQSGDCSCLAGYKGYAGTAQQSCSICPAGTFAAAGSGSCSACGTGTYALEGAAACLSCPCAPVGGTCDVTTGNNCTCLAGFGGNGVTCTICPAGTAKAAGNGSCAACASDSFADSPGSSACQACSCTGSHVSCQATTGACLCDAGFGLSGASCAACSAGSASAQANNTCSTCAAGTFAAAQAESCSACTCVASATCDTQIGCVCPENTFGDGVSACTACPATSTSAAGSTQLSECLCPADTFMDSGSCTACPGGTSSAPGSTNQSQCQ